MKFGIDMSLEATQNSYFSFPTTGNTNMADPRICEVEATLIQDPETMYNRASKNM
jgi:hypothetical protein